MEKNDYNGRLFLKFMVDFYSNFTYLAFAGKMRKVREHTHISRHKSCNYSKVYSILSYIFKVILNLVIQLPTYAYKVDN